MQNVFLTDGFIQLSLDPAVTYTITGPGAVVAPFDPVTGLTGPIPPGAYSVSFVLDPLYSTAVPNPIPLTINAYPSKCDLTTAPLVVPLVSFTPPDCTAGGSYTLANDLAIPGAVLWTVDGTPGVADGTYPAATGSTVTVVAAPAVPLYGFAGGQQTTWSYTFSDRGGCLNTLAQTGSTPWRLGRLAVLLAVAGVLLIQRWSRERWSLG